jgi:hypothetical protein
MSKAKRARQRLRERERRQKEHPALQRPHWWRRCAGWFVGLETVAGVGFSIYEFRPQGAVYAESTLDPRNPFSTPFIISNTVRLPIYSVTRICYFQNLTFRKLGHVDSTYMSMEVYWPAIEPGVRDTLMCPFSVPDDELVTGDITIFVDYHWFYWPRWFTTEARFVTKQNADGTLRWLPVSLFKGKRPPRVKAP